MIIKWNDSDTLLEIDGTLVQFRNGETYDVDPERQPELTRFLRVKERQGGVEFIDLSGIATFEDDPKPLDTGEPATVVEGSVVTTQESEPEPEPTPARRAKNTEVKE